MRNAERVFCHICLKFNELALVRFTLSHCFLSPVWWGGDPGRLRSHAELPPRYVISGMFSLATVTAINT